MENLYPGVLVRIGYIRSDRKLIFTTPGSQLLASLVRNGVDSFVEIYTEASDDLNDIEVLVIIGYSFPYFNRKVDKDLFAKMKNIKKIYIQDLEPSNIKETMQEFFTFTFKLKGGTEMPVSVEFKTNKNQFVFPRELSI